MSRLKIIANLGQPNNLLVYPIRKAMSCGSGYHKYHQYVFCFSNKEQRTKWEMILEYANCRILNTRKNPLEMHVTFPTKRYGKLMFKLFRYFRNKDTEIIIDTIIACLDAGIPFYNAIVLGHYGVKEKPMYYADNMDIIPYSHRARYGFKSKQDFEHRLSTTGSYNSLFKAMPALQGTRQRVRELLLDGNFMTAQKLILDY